MPNLAKRLNNNLLSKSSQSIVLLYTLLTSINHCFANSYATETRYAILKETADKYTVNAEFKYHLSPTAKEALQKGIPLAWDVCLEIKSVDQLLNATLYQTKLPYSIQFHALLNQYEVKSPGLPEMFITLSSALNFMAKVNAPIHLDQSLFIPGKNYQLAVKTEFNREFLPVPLRPEAYFSSQWFLSSDWFLWSFQK